jgi:hypothetical protein
MWILPRPLDRAVSAIGCAILVNWFRPVPKQASDDTMPTLPAEQFSPVPLLLFRRAGSRIEDRRSAGLVAVNRTLPFDLQYPAPSEQ